MGQGEFLFADSDLPPRRTRRRAPRRRKSAAAEPPAAPPADNVQAAGRADNSPATASGGPSTSVPPLSGPKVFTVTQLTRLIQLTLTEHLPGRLTLQGELSNFRRPASGHIYLTLKDEAAQIPAVMWRTKEWKLVLYLPGEFRHLDRRLDEYHGELYDLAADPGEHHNRYDDRDLLSVRERLTRQLLLHMTVAWSRFPRPYSYTDID